MCLVKQEKTDQHPYRRKLSKPEFTAWKVAYRADRPWSEMPVWESSHWDWDYLPGVNVADLHAIPDRTGGRYTGGFHCFLRREDARRNKRGAVILKVRIRSEDVTAVGPDGPGYRPCPTVVATVMTVEGEVR